MTPVTLRDYLRLIFRRKVFFFVPVGVSLLLTVPIWLVVPPSYRAAATVQRKDLAVLRAAPSTLVGSGGSGVALQTLRTQIVTWPRLERLIKELKMDVDLRTPADWERKYQELRSSITISSKARARGIDIIEVAATHNNPDLAQLIANAIADYYVEESQKISRTDTQEYAQFVEKGERDYLAKLRKVEDEIDAFNRKRFQELPEVKRGMQARLLELRTQERMFELQLTTAQNRLAEVEKQLEGTPAIIKTKVRRPSNPEMLEMQRRLRAEEIQLEELQRRYTAQHPEVLKKRAHIESLRRELAETPERLAGDEEEAVNPAHQQLVMDRMQLNQEIRGLQASLTKTRAWITANEQEIRSVAEDEKRYSDLLRQKQEYSEMYQQYRRQLVTAQHRMQAEAGDYGTEVTMEARALRPATPYRLPRIQYALGCVGAGFALGIALMFGVEFCDQSLRGVEDAAAFLEIPVLGSVLTIVTPEEEAQQKRWRFWIIAVCVALIALAVVGVAVWEWLNPGLIAYFLEQVRAAIGG